MPRLAPRLAAALALAAPLWAPAHAAAEPPALAEHQQRVELDALRTLRLSTRGEILLNERIGGGVIMPADCTQSRTHADESLFGGGSFFMQAGFATDEIAAQSYTLPAHYFPLQVDMMEMIFATQNAVVETVTEWSVLIWEGTPDNGTLVGEFSSDDISLPHLRIGPGTQGVNLQVVVDPNDPDQIVILNTGGSNTFTIGFRIDKHNAPSGDPCSVPPPANRNAFPVTDTDGVADLDHNWLRGLNCGPFGCPPNGGWASFRQLAAGLCRPSGDWVIRATFTRLNCQPGVGACCLPDGSCDTMFEVDCDAAGGLYQGDGTPCDIVNCPEPVGACCNPQGGCLGDLTAGQCASFGGLWAGPGTDCDDANGNGIADDCEGCPADIDGDGDADVNDFFGYLDLFAAGDPRADFTGDGAIDVNDFFAYLDAFAAGC